ncbi:MAG TPA: BNR-4 repeat-containing protein [Pyrinomonadaceae bacterium]|nr:BNR-4 repeat-containing protein [Pyrinomonadaceae bacterium]
MFSLLLSCVLAAHIVVAADLPQNYVAGTLVQLNDNGAWSWFMDERAIVHEGKLIVGSVRAIGDFSNNKDPDWGNVEIAVYDIASGTTQRTVFHRHFEQDDHDGPAFLPLPDGRLLAMYTKHGGERRIYYRFSEPRNPLAWGPAFEFETPGVDSRTFSGDNVTYSNLFRLRSGRILNIFRGPKHDPNYMYSNDSGRTWRYGGRILRGREGYSPYLKYAFDRQNTIHFVVTDNHPRNYDNSIYHGFIRDGSVYLSDGAHFKKLSDSTEVEIAAWDLTKVFQGDADNVGWVIDLELDSQQRPYVVFSVQKDGRDLPPKQGGMDHRFYYGRWDGSTWRVHEIAYAGTRLYAGEDDYTGLAALDPNKPDVVYISTDAHPTTGASLVSRADGKRHREIYRGVTRDSGATWTWTPITANSTVDNLRPLVPNWNDPRTALVWMRGGYYNNRGEWTTAVVATILPPAPHP